MWNGSEHPERLISVVSACKSMVCILTDGQMDIKNVIAAKLFGQSVQKPVSPTEDYYWR
jgi:hypothetical protein